MLPREACFFPSPQLYLVIASPALLMSLCGHNLQLCQDFKCFLLTRRPFQLEIFYKIEIFQKKQSLSASVLDFFLSSHWYFPVTVPCHRIATSQCLDILRKQTKKSASHLGGASAKAASNRTKDLRNQFERTGSTNDIGEKSHGNTQLRHPQCQVGSCPPSTREKHHHQWKQKRPCPGQRIFALWNKKSLRLPCDLEDSGEIDHP